jgi:hypothetical protein
MLVAINMHNRLQRFSFKTFYCPYVLAYLSRVEMDSITHSVEPEQKVSVLGF